MTETIYFDMDGTIVNLYGVADWLPKLQSFDPSPYEIAKPLIDLRLLAIQLNRLQKEGYRIGIISWLSRETNREYDQAVIKAKIEWLINHLPSVVFDEIKIVPYGTSKSQAVDYYKNGILFDDNAGIRAEWGEDSFKPSEIFDILKELF